MSEPIAPTVANALIELGCDESNICTNEDPSTLEWLDPPTDFTPPSNEDILAKKAELDVIWQANLYYWDRKYAYPTWSEQLDMQYNDAVNGTTTWQDAIDAIKAKYPKPE